MKKFISKNLLTLLLLIALALTAFLVMDTEKVHASPIFGTYNPYTTKPNTTTTTATTLPKLTIPRPTAPTTTTNTNTGFKILDLTGSKPQYVTYNPYTQPTAPQWPYTTNTNNTNTAWTLPGLTNNLTQTQPTPVPNTNVVISQPTTISGLPAPKSYSFGTIYDQQGNPYFSPYSIPNTVVQSYLHVNAPTAPAKQPTTPTVQPGYYPPTYQYGYMPYPMMPYGYPGYMPMPQQPGTTQAKPTANTTVTAPQPYYYPMMSPMPYYPYPQP